jgi:type I restriction enzyme, S subunit
MRLGQFFQKFELFADSPSAVGKMRELVLDLAMRGRLLDQAESRQSDELPPGWRWQSLGELAQFINGDRSKNYPSKSFRVNDGIPFINAGHLLDGDVALADMDYITQEHFDRLGNGKVERGDVLYCLRGSLGKSAVVQSLDRGAIASSLLIIRPTPQVMSQFIYLYLISPLGAQMISKYNNGSAQPNLSATNVKKFVAPLPPLAEQKRIVAKVDELMALCDRLEAQQEERETRHAALARASLGRFAEAPSPANLDFLFHPSCPLAPADLRTTILGLAVQGKLVPQVPYDEPATAMLEKIVSTAKPTSRGNEDSTSFDAPFEIPESWTWVKLPRVLRKLTDGTHHSPPNGPSGEFMYISAKNIKADGVRLDEITYVTKQVHEEIYSRCDPSYGDVLYIKDGATTGIATINQIKEPFSMLSSVALLKPSEAIFNRYLLWAMRSPFFYEETRGAMKGAAITRVTLSVMAASLLPLPPLAEQHRIVAKVDQLMALVDQLETQLTVSCATAERLMQAAIAELTTTTDTKIRDKIWAMTPVRYAAQS